MCRSILLLRLCFFFFQAEDGIRDLVRSRGLGDVYKRQDRDSPAFLAIARIQRRKLERRANTATTRVHREHHCLLYTSDAADERSSVDLGGRRIIKKKKNKNHRSHATIEITE